MEVIFDPVEYEYCEETGTVFDPSCMFILDCDWAEWLREELDEPRLFVYYHGWSQNTVLAYWVYDPEGDESGPGLMVELDTFKGHPDHRCWKRPSISYVAARLAPQAEVVKKHKKELVEFKEFNRALRAETYEERLDAAKFLEKQGYYKEAVDMRLGATPFVGEREGGDMLAQTKERLIGAHNGRQIFDLADNSRKSKIVSG